VRGCGRLAGGRFSNSLRHSGSGAPGETVTVAVKTVNDVIRVEVTERSGPQVPEPRPAGNDAEDGRGLHLVAGLTARWGWPGEQEGCADDGIELADLAGEDGGPDAELAGIAS